MNRFTRAIVKTIAALALSLHAAFGAASEEPASLDRITVEDGTFVKQTAGERFVPKGFNYIRLNGWHGAFRPGGYEPERAEAMLADISERGFNIVRVFINHNPGYVVAGADAAELHEPYMVNVLDFLERATAHGVYVIFSLQYVPDTPVFNPLRGETTPKIAPVHRRFLHEQGIAANAEYYGAFAGWIAEHAPRLLPTVFAYELGNEMHFRATAEPFSLTEGEFTGVTGERYDLASDEEKQQLADDHTVAFAGAAVEAVREADSEAMVSVNVFTFAAVGRSGPAALSEDSTDDARFPVRPLALTRSKLDYLDIHLYSLTESGLERDLASIEGGEVLGQAKERGMPIILGEFGVFKHEADDPGEAAERVEPHLRRVLDLGFQGYLYWTYDTDEQDYLWNARSGDGEILDMLTEFNREYIDAGR